MVERVPRNRERPARNELEQPLAAPRMRLAADVPYPPEPERNTEHKHPAADNPHDQDIITLPHPAEKDEKKDNREEESPYRHENFTEFLTRRLFCCLVVFQYELATRNPELATFSLSYIHEREMQPFFSE
jgi:hypothetical protein